VAISPRLQKRTRYEFQKVGRRGYSRARTAALTFNMWRIARAKPSLICYLLGFMPVEQFVRLVKER
jgi:hypothetical protein